MKRLSELHDVNSDIKRLRARTDTECSETAHGSLIHLPTDQDAAHLRTSLEQLNTTLEKTNRRINRLLGEKKQLSALLDKRDDQIERLSRELGRYTSGWAAGAARSDRLSRFINLLAAALTSVTERIRHFPNKTPGSYKDPAGDNQSGVPDQHSHLVARRKADMKQQVVAVLLFGLSRSEIEQLFPTIQRDCSAKRMTPLCLIDMDGFELLRSRDLIFESLPPADDRNRFDSTLNWNLYIQRRLTLIRKKWNPIRLVAFGAPATEILTLWSTSPFEDSPLPAASGATDTTLGA